MNVVGTVVIEASERVGDNQRILELAKTHPAIVSFFGHLVPGQAEFAGNLRRFAADPLFRGLRMRSSYLKGITEPAVAADLKRVADLGLSVDVMGGAAILGPTLRLSRLLPGLRIVIDHVPFGEWDADPAAMRPALDTWCELFAPERVVYGSNWPVSDRVARYATVHRVATAYFAIQDRTTAESYFWRNSHVAYRWVRRGAAATLGR